MAYNTGYTPFYLMFGCQARLPADVIYGTPNTPEQSVTNSSGKNGGCIHFGKATQSLKQHHRQKELYDRKVHGKPFKRVIMHGLILPWSGEAFAKIASSVVRPIQSP